MPLLFLRNLPVGGIAIFPFILINRKAHPDYLSRLINHEKIHIRQQLELLILPFYLIYLGNYLFNLMRFGNHQKAYREIIFEREAFANEANHAYLPGRKRFNFIRYIKRENQPK